MEEKPDTCLPAVSESDPAFLFLVAETKDLAHSLLGLRQEALQWIFLRGSPEAGATRSWPAFLGLSLADSALALSQASRNQSPRRSARASRPPARNSQIAQGAARSRPVRAPSPAPGCPRVGAVGGRGRRMGSWRSLLLSRPRTCYCETGVAGTCSRKGRGRWEELTEVKGPSG